jgi:hypothetical protein
LRNIVDGCPERGVNVTVYGIPWNAMLTFGAAAGPVRNKAELKRRYDGGIGAARGGGGDFTDSIKLWIGPTIRQIPPTAVERIC